MNWRELAEFIGTLDDIAKCCNVQIAMPGGNLDEIVALQPVISAGTVASFEFTGARSSHDNRYHNDEPVLLVDHNPFGENGEVSWELLSDGSLGNPSFGKNGPTERKDQLATCPPEDPDFPAHVEKVVFSRVERAEGKDTNAESK